MRYPGSAIFDCSVVLDCSVIFAMRWRQYVTPIFRAHTSQDPVARADVSTPIFRHALRPNVRPTFCTAGNAPQTSSRSPYFAKQNIVLPRAFLISMSSSRYWDRAVFIQVDMLLDGVCCSVDDVMYIYGPQSTAHAHRYRSLKPLQRSHIYTAGRDFPRHKWDSWRHFPRRGLVISAT